MRCGCAYCAPVCAEKLPEESGIELTEEEVELVICRLKGHDIVTPANKDYPAFCFTCWGDGYCDD